MNRIRLITSGILFLFSIICLIWFPTLPFNLPLWVYILGTTYFALFPIKDMIGELNKTSYKGRPFKKNYKEDKTHNPAEFESQKRKNNIRAIHSFLFWITFVSIPATLYFLGIIGPQWIFFLFALSNFAVFFAIFGWCPFHKIFIRPECCNECRIHNWDSFFQYSFLILIPNIFTITLFSLGVISLIHWEIIHAKHPKRFYKISNTALDCETCDMEGCKQNKKRFFSKKLK